MQLVSQLTVFVYLAHDDPRQSHLASPSSFGCAGRWHSLLTNLLEIVDPMEFRHHNPDELPLIVTGCELVG